MKYGISIRNCIYSSLLYNNYSFVLCGARDQIHRFMDGREAFFQVYTSIALRFVG